jgi:hypothetical protein
MRRAVLVLCFLFLALPSYAQKPIRVYVFAKTTTDGFVDSGQISDTVKDIRDAISKRKDLTWTFTKESADIMLEVVAAGRAVAGTQSNTNTQRGIFGGINSTTTTNEKTLPSITAVLHVKNSDYEKELSITKQLFWKDLARNIVGQTGDWIKANRSRFQ